MKSRSSNNVTKFDKTSKIKCNSYYTVYMHLCAALMKQQQQQQKKKKKEFKHRERNQLKWPPARKGKACIYTYNMNMYWHGLNRASEKWVAARFATSIVKCIHGIWNKSNKVAFKSHTYTEKKEKRRSKIEMKNYEVLNEIFQHEKE